MFKFLKLFLQKNKNFMYFFDDKAHKTAPSPKNLILNYIKPSIFGKKLAKLSNNTEKKENIGLTPQKKDKLPLLLMPPKKESESPMLLLPSKKIQISGLMYINEKEKIFDLCQNKAEFVQVFLPLKAMILYYFFSDKYFEKNLLEKIQRSFSIDLRHLKFKNIQVQQYFLDKEISLKQHIISYIGHGKTFPLEMLKQTFPNISFTGFGNNGPINLWIETYIADRCLNFNTVTKYKNVEIINPENDFFYDCEKKKFNNTNFFNPKESQNQVGQSFADVHIYNLTSFLPEGISIESFYKDVKAKYQGPLKGHLTIIPSMNEKFGISYMINIISSLKEKIIKIENVSLKKKAMASLQLLQEIAKKYPYEKSFIVLKQFNLALKEISLEPLFKHLQINFTIASDLEEMEYEDIITFQEITDDLSKPVSKNLFDLKKLGFRDSIHNPKEFSENIEKIIELLPPYLQQQCLTNFQKYLEI